MKQELIDAVNNYQASDKVVGALQGLNLIAVASPTGGGKNAVIKELVKDSNYNYAVSHTTREPRENNGVMEENGVNYWFVTEDEMIQLIDVKAFVEVKNIFGRHVSGTSLKELLIAKEAGKKAVVEIDVQGVSELRKLKPDMVAVFLTPPDFTEWIRRLQGRKSGETMDEYKARMMTAEKEIQTALEDEDMVFIINDQIVDVVTRLYEILRGGKYDDKKARQTAWNVLNDLKQNLYS